MYKLFKLTDLMDYGLPGDFWKQVGQSYSKLELENLKRRLPQGTYMLAEAAEFSVPHKTFKQLCNERPVP